MNPARRASQRSVTLPAMTTPNLPSAATAHRTLLPHRIQSSFHRSLVAIAIMICPCALGAATLSSIRGSGFGLVIGQGVLPPVLPLQFALAGNAQGTPCFVPSASCVALFDLNLTASDIGSTFAFGPSDNGFASVSDFLTTGVGNEWSFALSNNPGGAVGLGPVSPLSGDTISQIDLTVNNLTFSQVQLPGPSGFETFTQAELDVTATVLGAEAPEPRFRLLLAAILIFVPLFRRRQDSPETPAGKA